MRAPVRVVLGVLPVVVWAAAVSAQTLTGTIIGRVTDQSGLPLPGVSVVFTSPQMIKAQEEALTNEDGRYRLPAAPPGTYRIRFELTGFQPVVREGIALPAGDTLAVDVSLGLAAVTEDITVQGESPMVDVTSTAVGTTASQQLLENVPMGRTFNNILSIVPGVVSGSSSNVGTFTVFGSPSVSNIFAMDGLNISDPYQNVPNLFLPNDMFQEVQVTTGAFSAEFGNAEGGVFNFITKSGGNRFSGETSFYYQDESLQSSNIDDDLRRQGVTRASSLASLKDLSGSLGGPVLRDRLWFFTTARRYDSANSIVGFDGLQTVDHTPYFVKGTARVLGGGRVEVGYQRRTGEFFPENAGFATNADDRTWRLWEHREQAFNTNYTHVLSSKTFFTARGGFVRHNRAGAFPNSNGRTGARDSVTNIACCGWITLQGPQWRRGTRGNGNITHFVDDFAGGSHQLKAGFELELNQTGRDSIWPEDMFHLLQNNQPWRVQLFNTPVLGASDNVTIYAGFVQDEWTVGRATMNLGVRFDSSEAWLPAQSSPDGRWFPGASYPETRDLVNFRSVSPRLGLVYDVFGDRRTVLKASYGRYYGSIRTNQVPNPNSVGNQTWSWNDLNGDRYFQWGEQGTLISDTRGGTAFSKVDPNLRAPKTDAVFVSVEREMFRDFSLSVTGVYKRGRDFGARVTENIPYSAYVRLTGTSPTGGTVPFFVLRPEFRGVRAVTLLTNPDDGDPERSRYVGLEIVGRKRMSDNWQMQASLNLSRSEDNYVEGVVESWDRQVGVRAIGGNRSNPNSLVNAYGRAFTDRPMVFKLLGTYMAPLGLVFSGSFQSTSGLPWARVVRFNRGPLFPEMVVESFVDVQAEPLGTQRFPTRHVLDARVEKVIRLGVGQIGVMADVFNVFNANTVAAYESSRTDSPFFQVPRRIEEPRILRLGVRFSF